MNSAYIKYKRRLKSAKRSVIKRFNRGKPKHWLNKDFSDLSFEINAKTKILISASTLKRIFGKNKTHNNYFPQEATLVAMEKYGRVTPETRFIFRKNNLAYLSIIFLLIGISVFLIGKRIFQGEQQMESELFESAILDVLKIDGNNPATVYFHYNLPSGIDSTFLHFGDSNDITYLAAPKDTISHYYRFPGSFIARLKTRESTIKQSVRFFIPTNGWQALGHYFEQDANERFFPIPLEQNTLEGSFHPTKKNLAAIGMDSTRIVVLRIDNFSQTEYTGDDFTLSTRFKNEAFWPAIRCYSAYVSIFGDEGEITIKIMNKGCSIHGQIILGEKRKTGLNHDLTNFAVDISEWQELFVRNEQKDISIQLNEKLIYSEEYTKSIGKINGVSVQFHGIGTLDYFELKDSKNQNIFANHFE